jgi:hypothetical protein
MWCHPKVCRIHCAQWWLFELGGGSQEYAKYRCHKLPNQQRWFCFLLGKHRNREKHSLEEVELERRWGNLGEENRAERGRKLIILLNQKKKLSNYIRSHDRNIVVKCPVIVLWVEGVLVDEESSATSQTACWSSPQIDLELKR